MWWLYVSHMAIKVHVHVVYRARPYSEREARAEFSRCYWYALPRGLTHPYAATYIVSTFTLCGPIVQWFSHILNRWIILPLITAPDSATESDWSEFNNLC